MTEFFPQEPQLPEKKSRRPLAFILPIALVVLGVVAFFLLKPPSGSECDKYYQSLAQAIPDKGDFSQKYAALIEENPDFKGFLTLNKGAYPVVAPSEGDEVFYLSHLFSGKGSAYGTPYTQSDLDKGEIIVIKGGLPKDGRMLGEITEYASQKYAESHPSISFFGEHIGGEYLVFSAFSYKTEKGEPFHIDKLSFLNDNVFNEYILALKENSSVALPWGAERGDKLLILLCQGKKEVFVLAARSLREDESADDPQEYVAPSLDQAEITEQKPPEEEKKPSSSPSSSQKPQTQAEKPSVIDDVPVSTNFETGRLEQTGLTADLDQSIKVDVGNVVTMVDVMGMSKSGARNVIENTLGLKVKLIEEESDQKRGTVIDQSVAEGADVSTDVPVTLTISAGISSGNTLIPDLIGQNEASLDILLDNADLRLGKVTSAASSLEKGTVLSQSISSGSEVAVKTKLDISVSDGSIDFKTVKMPSLIGKSKKKAISAIKSAGLKVGKITTVSSPKSAGTVVSQECPAAEKIEEGAAVGFSISNGSKVNNLTVTNLSSWSVTVGGKTYPSGAVIKGDYMDIIPCIIEAEMGSGFEIEALKAQAVAAYCWLINAGSKKGAAPGVPMKNPSEKAKNAASAVSGIELSYGGQVAQTYYYAISAGYSANCKDVWWADIPYLRAVESEGCKEYSGFKTTVTYSASKMHSMILDAYGIDLSSVSKSKWFSIKYDENDAYARSVSLGGKKTVTGSSIRDTLCSYELRSTAFKVKYSKASDSFTFTVRGYGHGVGMSQVGANYYAELGWSYEQILYHYYPGTKLS